MERAVIIDVLSTSAHYSTRDKLIGQEVLVRSTYKFEVFKEGYVSLYFTTLDGQSGCVFGCLIDYEVNPTWEL